MHNQQVSGWDPAIHVSGIIRSGGKDETITVTWSQLAGSLPMFALQTAIEHMEVSLEVLKYRKIHMSLKHKKMALKIRQWLKPYPKGIKAGQNEFKDDDLLHERFQLKYLFMTKNNAPEYAEELMAISHEKLKLMGTPPAWDLDFLLISDGEQKSLIISDRLPLLKACESDLPVEIVERDLLDCLIDGFYGRVAVD